MKSKKVLEINKMETEKKIINIPNGKDLGLSKKTNIALAAITGISLSNQIWQAAAIVIIALFFGTYQFYLDLKVKK